MGRRVAEAVLLAITFALAYLMAWGWVLTAKLLLTAILAHELIVTVLVALGLTAFFVWQGKRA